MISTCVPLTWTVLRSAWSVKPSSSATRPWSSEAPSGACCTRNSWPDSISSPPGMKHWWGLLSWFRVCPHPVLVPLGGFLQPWGGPLRATLTGCHKGITAMAWGVEEVLLVIGTQDGIVAVWDMEERQVMHILTAHTGEACEMGFMVSLFLVFHREQSLPRTPPPQIHFSISKLWPLFLHQLARAA